MQFAIYKPGQGYWTRAMSAVGLGLLVLMGVVWIWKILGTVRLMGQEPIYGQAEVAMVMFGIAILIGWQLLCVKPRVVDFMIATEGEMKKVNWSSRREITGSTWVVIGVTIFLAVLCFAFDFLFQLVFTWLQVLETKPS